MDMERDAQGSIVLVTLVELCPDDRQKRCGGNEVGNVFRLAEMF